MRPLIEGTLHGGRGTAWHTVATLLIEHGVNIRAVQEVLDHPRVTTTERYAHVSTPLMRDAGERGRPPCSGESPERCDQDCDHSTFGDQKALSPCLGRGPLKCGGSGI
ncbi:tyrosine-type recombinase/integrase [Streptosporangium sp. NPDC049078]|uniref:tyrosine-type recombinase/integrase n=1 Tax=Streptosporangium sp. NPDC049078 TaxID=3155767 RepID=UPI00344037A2